MSAAAEVLFDRLGGLGVVTLNRPKALNALTLGMVRSIATTLTDWSSDDSVKLVLIRGAGERGLCAGGDIRAIYEAAVAADCSPITFWREEYDLNLQIANYPKPIIAIMNGIVMGGGIGLSAHASHRVVTETTSIAMPETSIGFIPDIGGTYLLSRQPGEFGTHLALTSGRVGAADAMMLGLADIHISNARLPDLFNTLFNCRFGEDVSGAIGLAFSALANAPERGRLADSKDWINQAYAANSVEEICNRLSRRSEPGAKGALAELMRNSPTSLKVTLRALREARRFGQLAPCLETELNIASHCLFGHDFREGIRAAVIDKDRNPKWSPATLEEVTDAMVETYFQPAPALATSRE